MKSSASYKSRGCVWLMSAAASAALGIAAPAAHAQFSFDPPTTLPIFERPDGVTGGDLNGDNLVDLAVTSDTPDKVSIFLGDGAGGFAAGSVIFTGAGTGAGHLIAADLDGDLDLDLAVALKNINTIQMYINNGLGAFTPGSSASVGANPRWIAAAKLDANPSVDLATADRDGNTVSVLLNNGSGSFAVSSVAAGIEPRSVAAGDFNGDNAPDLVVSNNRDRDISILTNSGAGTFPTRTDLPVGADVRPDGVTTEDLDNDGDTDIAVATSGNVLNLAAIFVNGGTGTFSGPFNYNVGGVNPDTIVAADFDCDGLFDLATSNQDSNNLSVLPNLGGASFGAAMLLAVGTLPGTLIAENLDNDSDPDLAVANTDSNDVSVLINQTCPAFALGDMNCDGGLDAEDIDPFFLALGDIAAYQAAFPDCDFLLADVNADGGVDSEDIDPFFVCLANGGCP